VKRVAAPALQLQLTKALAELAGISQGEVARLSELPPPPAPVRPVPGAQFARAKPSAQGLLERTLLRCLLACPERAAAVDVSLIESSNAEGAALAALVDWLQHDAGTASAAAVIERFQGGEHGRAIAEAQAAMLAEGTAAEDAAIVLDDAVERLRERFRRRETARLRALIEAGTASEAQKLEYAKLSSYRPGLNAAPGAPSNLL
jgi:hypothetical protein